MSQVIQRFNVRFHALELDVQTSQTLSGALDVGIDVSAGRRVLLLDILAMTGDRKATYSSTGELLYETRQYFGASMLASSATTEVSALFGFSGMVAASMTTSGSNTHYKLDTSHLPPATAGAIVDVLPFGGALTSESLEGMMKVFSETWPAEIERTGAVVTTDVQINAKPSTARLDVRIRAARNASYVIREIAADRTEAEILVKAEKSHWGPGGPSTDLVRVVCASFEAEVDKTKAAQEWLHFHLV